jgi:hypothetical protein
MILFEPKGAGGELFGPLFTENTLRHKIIKRKKGK